MGRMELHDTIFCHDVLFQVHCVSVYDNDYIHIYHDDDNVYGSHRENDGDDQLVVDEPLVDHELMLCEQKLE
tara:strand:- start:415 stop:630 length:216 start_codon:yes stop_codon:yes gene_type:complete